MQVRTPAVAGMFYPGEEKELKQIIHGCFLHEYGPGNLPPAKDNTKVFGVISPHAGYMYSGPVACHSYHAISSQEYDLFIIIGPNHWGIGCNIASMRDCKWKTPLGSVEVDSETANELKETSNLVELDFFSHAKEHSLEVQIPILQEVYLNKFKILPIALISQDKKSSIEIGYSVAKIAKKKKAMIIGSSDFTHYEPNDVAHKQDMALMESILKMDVNEFYKVLEEKQISACGYGAIASTMVACKELGASKGILLKYATSGDITGDKTSVVGYGSIVFN